MNKRIGSINNLIFDIFLLIIGLICIMSQFIIWNFSWFVMFISIVFLSFNQFLLLFIVKKIPKNFTNISKLIAGFIFLFYLGFETDEVIIFIPYVVGWWALLISLIQFINYYVYRKDCLRGAFYRFLLAIISLGIGLYLILNPMGMLPILTSVAGIYLIISSIISIFAGIKEIMSDALRKKITKHTNISVPIFLAAIIPMRAFMSINTLKKQNIKNSEDFDFEVFIYLKGHGPESLGHVDIAYKGKIFSYGLHDPQNRSLHGTLGDGVLIVADRGSFLKQHIEVEKKLIISYGIKLSDIQKKVIEKRITNLMERAIDWKCSLANLNADASDYASRVFKATDAKMYKFSQGKFRTYFVFSTNCVLLADHIARSKELALFDFNGMVSPGSYISFLNNEYLRPTSSVVSRIIMGDENGRC